jgi:hypothetical protein
VTCGNCQPTSVSVRQHSWSMSLSWSLSTSTPLDCLNRLLAVAPDEERDRQSDAHQGDCQIWRQGAVRRARCDHHCHGPILPRPPSKRPQRQREKAESNLVRPHRCRVSRTPAWTRPSRLVRNARHTGAPPIRRSAQLSGVRHDRDRSRRTGHSVWPTWPGAEDAGEVSLLKFVDEHLDRFDGDLRTRPHDLAQSHMSHAPSGLRAFRGSGTTRSRSVPWSATAARRRNRTSVDTGLQALHYGAVRAQIKVIGKDASAVAARDADKVRVWLSRR